MRDCGFGIQPGNANLPIGEGFDLLEDKGKPANREIGVPRVHPPARELEFKLGDYLAAARPISTKIVSRGTVSLNS